MGLKIKALIIMSFILAVTAGCEKKSNPILSEPSSSIYALNGVCTQVDVNQFPQNRAFLSIADQNDQPVFDFSVGNFSVVEENKPDVVTDVHKVDNNADTLSIALVLDRSGSMYGSPTDELNVAAVNFVDQLGVHDEAEIINFETTVSVSQGFTSNKNLLKTAILNAPPGNSTALYDAIGQAVSDLSNRNGRKFVLAMTDGGENASQTYTGLESITDFANSKGLSVFTVGLGNLTVEQESALKNLSADSGGRYLHAANPADLDTVFQKALNQFNNEVEVHFRTLNSGKRHLKVYMNYGKFTNAFEKTYGD